MALRDSLSSDQGSLIKHAVDGNLQHFKSVLDKAEQYIDLCELASFAAGSGHVEIIDAISEAQGDQHIFWRSAAIKAASNGHFDATMRALGLYIDQEDVIGGWEVSDDEGARYLRASSPTVYRDIAQAASGDGRAEIVIEMIERLEGNQLAPYMEGCQPNGLLGQIFNNVISRDEVDADLVAKLLPKQYLLNGDGGIPFDHVFEEGWKPDPVGTILKNFIELTWAVGEDDVSTVQSGLKSSHAQTWAGAMYITAAREGSEQCFDALYEGRTLREHQQALYEASGKGTSKIVNELLQYQEDRAKLQNCFNAAAEFNQSENLAALLPQCDVNDDDYSALRLAAENSAGKTVALLAPYAQQYIIDELIVDSGRFGRDAAFESLLPHASKDAISDSIEALCQNPCRDGDDLEHFQAMVYAHNAVQELAVLNQALGRDHVALANAALTNDAEALKFHINSADRDLLLDAIDHVATSSIGSAKESAVTLLAQEANNDTLKIAITRASGRGDDESLKAIGSVVDQREMEILSMQVSMEEQQPERTRSRSGRVM